MADFPVMGAPNAGDTAWMLASSALVLLMTPGLAFFYGGMVGSKSVLNMLMMSFSALGVMGILWVLYGYSTSFGNDILGTGSGGLLGMVKRTFGLRSPAEDEELGIDEAEHAETAYDLATVGPGSAFSLAQQGGNQ